MLALIVDDSRIARAVIRNCIAELGFDAVEAGDGVEALERLQGAAKFDVAFVDWNMPEMDGLQLLKAIRADDRHAELPVLMVTAETDSRLMTRALFAGADEYAMKPIDRAALHDKLALLGLLPEEV